MAANRFRELGPVKYSVLIVYIMMCSIRNIVEESTRHLLRRREIAEDHCGPIIKCMPLTAALRPLTDTVMRSEKKKTFAHRDDGCAADVSGRLGVAIQQ